MPSDLRPKPTAFAVLACVLATGGCTGMQSALDPAGPDAEYQGQLFTWMVTGGLLIWAGVVVLALILPRLTSLGTHRAGTLLVVGGGVVFPVTVLTFILLFSLPQLSGILEPGPDEPFRIEVRASQWWWRVRYVTADGQSPIELANEIRLPVGRRVNVQLGSTDVIHSFWVPPLAGKMDMVPGRLTRIALEPGRTGTFRGACAEYCGMSHARMNLMVVAMEPPDFDAWLAGQRQAAATPAPGSAERGAQAFAAHGCAMCHRIRGTGALGTVGPDLTHVGSRLTIAAGTLPNTPGDMRHWITATHDLKPGVHMPAFEGLPDATLDDLAAYLDGLQ